MNEIQILPELFGKQAMFHQINVDSKIGSFRVRAPVVMAAMGSTKVANTAGPSLSKGAGLAGIPMVIGENMLASHGKAGLKARMQPYLDNREKGYGALVVQGNGVDINMGVFEAGNELGADAVEVKLGQGAKQNLGGEITFTEPKDAEKYKKMGYHVVKNPDGTYQRHTPVGALDEKALTNAYLKAAETDLPIWVKIAIGRGIVKFIEMTEKIKKQHGLKIEVMTIDGHGGGTGMSPWLIMEETSLPSATVLPALKKKPSFDIVLAGGYNDGFDVAKAMMLGARGAAMGRAFLIAGKVTPDVGVKNFVEALREELEMVCATQRITDVLDLQGRRNNLVALSKGASDLFGLTAESKKVL